MKYNLDEFFQLLCKEAPEMRNKVSQYKKILNEAEKNKTVMVSKESLLLEETEMYEQTFHLASSSYYTLTWNVELAKIITKKYYKEGPNTNFYLPTLIEAVKQEELNVDYLNKALINEEPIIIGYYPMINRPYSVIIDGNHRIISKARAGVNTFHGYFLTPEQHVECMSTNIDQVLYKIHHNIFKHFMKKQGVPLVNFQYDSGFLDF